MAWNMHQTSFSNCLAVGTKIWWFVWRCGRCVGLGPRGIFRNRNCWLSMAMVTPPPAQGGWGDKLSSTPCGSNIQI